MPDSATPQDNPERGGVPGAPTGGPVDGPPQQSAPGPPQQSAPIPPPQSTPVPAPSAAQAASADGGAAPTPSPSSPGDRPAGASKGLQRRKLVWALAALVCVAAGAVGSVLGAHAVARSDNAKARRSSQQTSAGIASTVKLVIQRNEDLAVSAGTFFAGNSKTSPAEFDRWARWARALRSFPELEQLGLLTLVRVPELAAFEARVSGHEVKPLESGAAQAATGAFRVVPASNHHYHCLAVAEVARSAAVLTPAGLDYCGKTPKLLVDRDSGLSSYGLVSVAGTQALAVETPVYRGNVTPHTVVGRRAASVGWLREVLAPQVVLAQALQSHPDDAASLSYRTRSVNAVFTSGTPQPGAQSTTIGLHNGWTVQGFAVEAGAGVLSDGNALALLIVGCLLSALLGLLVFVLGSGRRPALARVPAAKTREVPHDDLYDALTGLPNRALMLDRAACMLARAGRQSGLLVGSLFIDIDWFKDVNDRLGPVAGDQLLKIVAERLENVVRAGDTVGRLGADEFVVLVETAARGARLDSLARRVVEALHKPFELDDFGPNFFLTASIGVAFGRYATPDDLLRDAQLALYAAKSAGKDRYTLFNANMRSVIEGRGVLEAELNTALAEKQFFLLYQPIYDLSTKKVVGLEARVRWLHPKQGVLAPEDFIPLAEETGLIVPIGRWVLEEACGRGAAWNVAGHQVGISVAVSATQLNRDGFATDVRRALQQSGIEPSLLTLEIAETTVMSDIAAAVERLEEIKRLGVRVAIDDFGGSGYAYHSDLRRMPLDFLKVDRSSLAAAEDEDYRTWLLEAILIVGRDLSLTVIAKGIETQEQLDSLHAMGCTMAQGALMGQPTPANNIQSVFDASLPTAPASSTGVAH
jgi:diguanylate cyclase (GGDEF)-like protein